MYTKMQGLIAKCLLCMSDFNQKMKYVDEVH